VVGATPKKAQKGSCHLPLQFQGSHSGLHVPRLLLPFQAQSQYRIFGGFFAGRGFFLGGIRPPFGRFPRFACLAHRNSDGLFWFIAFTS
jgi:hypothetical protein